MTHQPIRIPQHTLLTHSFSFPLAIAQASHILKHEHTRDSYKDVVSSFGCCCSCAMDASTCYPSRRANVDNRHRPSSTLHQQPMRTLPRKPQGHLQRRRRRPNRISRWHHSLLKLPQPVLVQDTQSHYQPIRVRAQSPSSTKWTNDTWLLLSLHRTPQVSRHQARRPR